jgi:hypothetical protein
MSDIFWRDECCAATAKNSPVSMRIEFVPDQTTFSIDQKIWKKILIFKRRQRRKHFNGICKICPFQVELVICPDCVAVITRDKKYHHTVCFTNLGKLWWFNFKLKPLFATATAASNNNTCY